jgi:hypothetical protein
MKRRLEKEIMERYEEVKKEISESKKIAHKKTVSNNSGRFFV